MTEPLKPCPFCHSKAIPETSRHTTRCSKIIACAGGLNEVPVELWNTRSPSVVWPSREEIFQLLYDNKAMCIAFGVIGSYSKEQYTAVCNQLTDSFLDLLKSHNKEADK